MHLLFIFQLFAYVFVTHQQGKSVDELIQNVFGNRTVDKNPDKNPTTKSPVVVTQGLDGCTCVPYYLCNNGTINKDGTGVIDIRMKQDNPCASYLEHCCNSEATTDRPITPKPNSRSGCGRRNPEGVGFRITGNVDNEAEFGEFPWMVALLRVESIDNNPNKLYIYQCGGALIHPKAVVTAAHCVTGKDKKFIVRAGEWDTQTKKELYPSQDRDVASVTIHPDYYAGALFNDIAVLILDSPMELEENVGVICLPPQGTNVDGARCIATGWGKNVFGKEGTYQVILKKIDLPIVDHSTCQTNLRKTRLGKLFELHSSFICAGGEEGKDTCRGDGGSPLVCPVPGQDNVYQHAGIVAWGIGCGEAQIPGVYANVATFRDWIDDQMTSNDLDKSTYQY